MAQDRKEDYRLEPHLVPSPDLVRRYALVFSVLRKADMRRAQGMIPEEVRAIGAETAAERTLAGKDATSAPAGKGSDRAD